MIRRGGMDSTTPPHTGLPRRLALLGGAGLLAGCVSEMTPRGPVVGEAMLTSNGVTLRDGAVLPLHEWQPVGAPHALLLALHGFNDSHAAWDIPAPCFAAAGVAVYAPDQRGFGAAPGRGLWAGGEALVDDAIDVIAVLRRRHPGTPLFLIGESMGGAVLMRLAVRPNAPAVAGYILIAPAVWGRSKMNPFVQAALWLASTLTPGLILANRPPPGVRVIPSDNIEALRALSANPLTIRQTRVDTLRGLVDLMDDALAAAPLFRAPALFQYGGRDDLIPAAATRATWRTLPPGPRLAFYPEGYHLLMRDLARAGPIGDALAWMADQRKTLPAAVAAAAWLGET